MPEKPTLDDLRREIDRIDDAIHDLLHRRTEVVEGVRDLKRGEPVKIRPAREDDILRRLVATHRGNFPKRSMVRIWRELITATLVFEGPFSVAAHAVEGETGCWDLARDHYGSFTPMTAYPSAARIVELVRNGTVSVGVLPFPRPDDREPWWPHLVAEAPDAPRIIARLPLAGPGNARGPVRDALAICPMHRESRDDDRAFLAIECAEELGLARLSGALRDQGLADGVADSWHEPGSAGRHLYLVEVKSSIADDDPGFRSVQEILGLRFERIIHLGAFGEPLSAADLDAPPTQP